ncbi:MAG: peroxiredoxin-like family protein [Woeseia sp.]
MSVGISFIRAAFITLWIAFLVVSLCSRSVAAGRAELPSAAEDISPLGVGDRAPAFTVRTVDDEPYYFDPDNLDRPTVLISFRGGWCPYCNMHLSELRHVVPDLKESGFDVLFLSNDRPDQLYEGLQRETQEDIDGLDYLILSDAGINAARALGTAFTISGGLIDYLENKERDYDESSIARHRALAVPSVFIVDRSGKIVFAYANPDYKVRLSATELKEAADRVLAQ